MRQLRRSSVSGRRQTGQTDRLSRSNLLESKQAEEKPAAVNQNQQCSQLQSLLPVCGASQTSPWGAALVLPSSMRHRSSKLALPADLARSVTAGLGEGCWSARQAFPPAKATHTHTHTHTQRAPCKAHLGAGLGTSERGCSGKPRTWGLNLVSGWNILPTSARISDRLTQQ